jgi:TPR repeat protein
MDNTVRQQLVELVARFGREFWEDPKRCKALLCDYCPRNKPEISVLVSAAIESVPAELLGSATGMPKEVLLSRLAKRLHDDLRIDADSARWSVESWALALGVVSAKESRIPFRCPGCGAAGSTASRLAGQTVQCPKCKSTVRVPVGRQETHANFTPPASPRETTIDHDIADAMELIRCPNSLFLAMGKLRDYFDGIPKERMATWKAAAEEGIPGAQVLYGLALAPRMSDTTEATETRAFKWFGRAAKQGYASGQFCLGHCYEVGYGVSQDRAKAAKWYRSAADQGHPAAQYQIGMCYYTSTGFTQDGPEAITWLRKAAEQGHADAQFFLGLCYSRGFGTLEDLSEAARWYREAAERGHSPAQLHLGFSYLHGGGVARDHREAAKWLQKAADQGISDAKRILEVCYDAVEGTFQDYAEAVTRYRKAAQEGDPVAQNALALCYANGQGVPRDYAKAAQWVRKAAEQGLADAQFGMGLCYRLGFGVPQDDTQAQQWHQRAIEQGLDATESQWTYPIVFAK